MVAKKRKSSGDDEGRTADGNLIGLLLHPGGPLDDPCTSEARIDAHALERMGTDCAVVAYADTICRPRVAFLRMLLRLAGHELAGFQALLGSCPCLNLSLSTHPGARIESRCRRAWTVRGNPLGTHYLPCFWWLVTN